MDKNSKLSSWGHYLMALIVGAIYPLAFAPFERWPVAILSVSALWWFLKDTSPKAAFRLGFCYGLGLFAVGVSWVYVSINTFGNAAPPLAVFLTILFVAILALLFALMAWLFRRYCANFSLFSQVICFSLLWLGINFFQSYSFISFPWLFLGYSQTGSIFMGIASLLGVHGVTLYLLPLAILTAEVATAKTINKVVALGLYLVLGLGLSWWGLSGKVEQGDSLNVALIQPNVDQHKKWDQRYFGEIVNGMLEQTESYWGADLVVWPEAAIPAMDYQVDFLLNDLSEKASESGSSFITGIPLLPNSQDKKTYYAGIKQLGDTKADYRKQQLVPFGEYVPFSFVLRGLIDFFDLPMSSFTPGSSEQAGFDTEKVYLIPAICYEIAFPNLIQNLSTKSADNGKPKAILTISNDTWFGESWGPLQHFQMAKMRAIENGLPVIRGTNNGLTALIDHYGQVLDQENRFEKAVLAGVIPLTQRHTWFNQLGHWPLILISLLMALAALLLRRTNKSV